MSFLASFHTADLVVCDCLLHQVGFYTELDFQNEGRSQVPSAALRHPVPLCNASNRLELTLTHIFVLSSRHNVDSSAVHFCPAQERIKNMLAEAGKTGVYVPEVMHVSSKCSVVT